MKKDTSNGITLKADGMATVKCGLVTVTIRYEDATKGKKRRQHET